MGNHRPSSLQDMLPELLLPASQEKPLPRSSRQQRTQQKRPIKTKEVQTDLFSLPLLPPLRTRFLASEIRLTRIPSLATTHAKEADGFLYHIANASMASLLLQEGLPLNKRHPLMLTEQNGISAWLAKLSDYVPDNNSADAVILRLRRVMVEDALEPDPDHTAEFASNCYLLSGNFKCAIT